MWQIDFNADVGEGFADAEIIPWLSSANISCGAHAGDEQTIRQALQLCLKHQVAAGANPAYPDRVNFGRLALAIPLPELYAHLQQQLRWFIRLADETGVTITHLKAHGALYNSASQDLAIGQLLLALGEEFQLPLLVLAQSPLHQLALQTQQPVVAEAFADRGYLANGTLVPRGQTGALLTTPQATAQCLQLVTQQTIRCQDGGLLSLQAQSLCLHGDSADAVLLAQTLHQTLRGQGIHIQAPWSRRLL